MFSCVMQSTIWTTAYFSSSTKHSTNSAPAVAPESALLDTGLLKVRYGTYHTLAQELAGGLGFGILLLFFQLCCYHFGLPEFCIEF